MVCNHTPDMRNDQEIFARKPERLPEDKKYHVIQTKTPAIKEFLVAKSTSFGGIGSRVPISYDVGGSIKEKINLLTQYQLANLDILKHQAYRCYVGQLADNAAFPEGQLTTQTLNPANNIDNRNIFHEQVYSNTVVELVETIVTPDKSANIG